ncbi:MAG: BatD family protein, partial [Niameybacter sp.]
TYNDKVYDTRIIREYLMYPRRAGVLQIEQLDIDLVAQLVTQGRRQSMFDDFFGGGQSVENVRRKVVSRPIKITVKDLPAGAPADFSGAVGKFTMQSAVSSHTLAANSAATYSITINGSGDMPLLEPLKLILPTSFEQYTVKTDDKYRNSISGSAGTKTFEYPFIARAEGNYTIDPVTFTYFDPAQKRYITLSTDPYSLTISADSTGGGSAIVSGVGKEEIKILGNDIRFIKSGSAELMGKKSFWIWSPTYFVAIILIVVLFVLLLIFLQKRIRESKNIVAVKGKRAYKRAIGQLKSAKIQLQNRDKKAFYNCMVEALWGYIGDKMNMATSDLNRDNIRENMLSRGVDQDVVTKFMDLMSACEEAIYAPTENASMDVTYERGIEVISEIESKL